MPKSFASFDLIAFRRHLETLSTVSLPLTELRPRARLVRIHRKKFPDPLGAGASASRFSDPRPPSLARPAPFRVLYASAHLATAFEEAVLRDRTDGALPPHLLSRTVIETRLYSKLEVVETLRLVDLSGKGRGWRVLGLPTDVLRGADQRRGRELSARLYDHRDRPDGILFDSRFDGKRNVAIYDRAISRALTPVETRRLDKVAKLRDILEVARVRLVVPMDARLLDEEDVDATDA